MNILVYPDPILRRPADLVTDLAEIECVLDDMFRTMYDAKGVGLAANQVGIARRFFVMNVEGQPGREIILINPEIVEGKDEVVASEGCLSLPGLEVRVPRWEWVKVRGQTLDGDSIELEGGDLFARAVQHELDHLDGRLIIDRISAIAKIAVRPRLTEMEKKFEGK